jgi:hypothetical protein
MKKEQDEIAKGMAEGTLKYAGSVTREEAKKISKRKYLLLFTNSSDIAGELLGTGIRNVYVYKRVKKT